MSVFIPTVGKLVKLLQLQITVSSSCEGDITSVAHIANYYLSFKNMLCEECIDGLEWDPHLHYGPCVYFYEAIHECRNFNASLRLH